MPPFTTTALAVNATFPPVWLSNSTRKTAQAIGSVASVEWIAFPPMTLTATSRGVIGIVLDVISLLPLVTCSKNTILKALLITIVVLFFQSDSNLGAHLRSTKHAGQTIKCVGCTRFFPTLSAMTIHLESGTCPSGITRQIVNNEIRARDTNHLITGRLLTYPDSNGRVDTWATDAAWNGRNFECYFCPREFQNLRNLNQHLQSPVHEQKIYHCPHCATKFKLFSGLVQHVESESCGIARFRDVKMAMDRLTSNLTRMIDC